MPRLSRDVRIALRIAVAIVAVIVAVLIKSNAFVAGLNFTAIALGISCNVGPMGIAIMLLIMRDRRWRYNISLLLWLMMFVALTAWGWRFVIRSAIHPELALPR